MTPKAEVRQVKKLKTFVIQLSIFKMSAAAAADDMAMIAAIIASEEDEKKKTLIDALEAETNAKARVAQLQRMLETAKTYARLAEEAVEEATANMRLT
jgi:hypothetical protein